MTIWPQIRASLLLPLRCPALVAVGVAYSGLLYAASLHASLLDVRNPLWVISVGGLLLLSPVFHGLLLPVTARALHGDRAAWGAAARAVLERYPALFLGQILVGAAVVAGGMLLLVPGIYAGMRFIHYKQAIVIDGRTAGAALKESVGRTRAWRPTVELFVGLAALYGAAIGLDALLVFHAPAVVVHVGAVAGTGWLLVWMNALVTSVYLAGRGSPSEPLDAADRR